MFRIQLDAEMQSCTTSRSKENIRINGVISAKRRLTIVPNHKSVPIMLDLSEQKKTENKKEVFQELNLFNL